MKLPRPLSSKVKNLLSVSIALIIVGDLLASGQVSIAQVFGYTIAAAFTSHGIYPSMVVIALSIAGYLLMLYALLDYIYPSPPKPPRPPRQRKYSFKTLMKRLMTVIFIIVGIVNTVLFLESGTALYGVFAGGSFSIAAADPMIHAVGSIVSTINGLRRLR